MPRLTRTACSFHPINHCTSAAEHLQISLLQKMRVFQALTALLLPLTALAAKKPSGDKFQEFHSKQVSASAPLKLNDASYADLTTAPRDYSVAVLLTALEARFGCGLCQEFQPEWNLLAKSWVKGDRSGESRLVFGTLDFTDGKGTFQSVSITLALPF